MLKSLSQNQLELIQLPLMFKTQVLPKESGREEPRNQGIPSHSGKFQLLIYFTIKFLFYKSEISEQEINKII